MKEQLLKIIQDEILKSRGSSIKRRRAGNLSAAASSWVSTTRIGDEIGRALSIVLNTIGCSHARGDSGGCTMCSYLLDGTPRNPTSQEILSQFEGALSKLQGEPSPLSVKIYTSGSFLDPEEITPDARKRILEIITEDDRISEVVLESRPEFVSEDALSEIKGLLEHRNVEIGIGLESSNDDVRNFCINKGFTLNEFQDAIHRAEREEIGVRSYVLVKPPFLTERDGIHDAQRTITDAIDLGVSTVSVNPVNVQKNTLVEYLWRGREYRPPWLWSLIEVLREAHESSRGIVTVVCDPVAAGKERGAHNCGNCDSEFVRAIRDFSLQQDPAIFSELECGCKNEWEHILKHEDGSNLIHATRMKS